MRRLAPRLFTLCSAVSLVICVAVCVLWMIAVLYPREFTSRTVQREGTVLVKRYGGFGWNGSAVAIARYEDRILFGQRYDAAFNLVGQPTEADEAFAAFSETVESRQPPDPLDFNRGEFRFTRKGRLEHFLTGGRTTGYGRATVVVVPFYQMALATGLVPLVWLATFTVRRRLRRRATPGLCASCGYDLRASPGRCPECGAAAG